MPIFNPILVGGGGSDAAPFSDQIFGYFSSLKGHVLRIESAIDVNGETLPCEPALSLPCEYWAARAALPTRLEEILGSDYASDAMVIDGTLSGASFQTRPEHECTIMVSFPGATPNSPIHVVGYRSGIGYVTLDCTVGNGTVEYRILDFPIYSII